MGRPKRQAPVVDLNDFKLHSGSPVRGKTLSWKYVSRSQPVRYTYVQPISPKGRPMSWIQVGIAISAGILILPLILSAPLLVALALGRSFPLGL